MIGLFKFHPKKLHLFYESYFLSWHYKRDIGCWWCDLTSLRTVWHILILINACQSYSKNFLDLKKTYSFTQIPRLSAMICLGVLTRHKRFYPPLTQRVRFSERFSLRSRSTESYSGALYRLKDSSACFACSKKKINVLKNGCMVSNYGRNCCINRIRLYVYTRV